VTIFPEEEPSAARSVDKALATVEVLLRSATPASAREIAERAGVNRTTSHRLLNALIRRGWAEKVPGTSEYRLNLRFLALAQMALHGRDFMGEVRPVMERLSDVSREAVHLGVLDGFEVVHVDKVDSPEMVGVASKVGTRAVPHVTALGKALLAAGPDDAVAAYVAHARMFPAPYQLHDVDRLMTDLRRVRDLGFSLDDEESSAGIRCLGVPILGVDGAPLFALSITGPAARFTADRAADCAPEAITAARMLSAQFGRWTPSIT
jgi:DNA-binding IclR family transcriptional regulator